MEYRVYGITIVLSCGGGNDVQCYNYICRCRTCKETVTCVVYFGAVRASGDTVPLAVATLMRSDVTEQRIQGIISRDGCRLPFSECLFSRTHLSGWLRVQVLYHGAIGSIMYDGNGSLHERDRSLGNMGVSFLVRVALYAVVCVTYSTCAPASIRQSTEVRRRMTDRCQPFWPTVRHVEVDARPAYRVRDCNGSF